MVLALAGDSTMTRGFAPARGATAYPGSRGGVSGASSDTVGSRSAFGMTSGKGERLARRLSTPPPIRRRRRESEKLR